MTEPHLTADQTAPADAPEVLHARIHALENELHCLRLEAEIAEVQMARAYTHMTDLYNLVPGLLLIVDDRKIIRVANHEAGQMLGLPANALRGKSVCHYLPDCETLLTPLLGDDHHAGCRVETQFLRREGEALPVLLSIGRLQGEGDVISLVLVGIDVRERKRLEVELRHAQKLEAIGSLAAGVAHEINTPMQFISDNLGFIGEGVASLLALQQATTMLLPDAARRDWEQAAQAADLPFLRERLPRAVSRAQDGVTRVSRIVNGMRLFAHPSQQIEDTDLNTVIDNALTVACNAYKYVADVSLDLGELPGIPCVRGDIAQVLINLLTNAAHAIEERVGRGGRGQIRIRTRYLDGQVILTIEDDGCGIPETVRHRIYDPFFTTKAVGRGTGQGLSISRSIIVDRHHGHIACEPVNPHGTCFTLTLPAGRPGVPQEPGIQPPRTEETGT